MKRIIVTRKKKLSSALMPFWIIPGSKQMFMNQFGLLGDITSHDIMGQPVDRIDVRVLDANGVRIKSGEQKVLDLSDDTYTVFACTSTGSLSNEVLLQGGPFINGIETYYLSMTVKGGMTTVSYPWFE